MQFPDHFPDNCPPDTAREALGTAYYLINGSFPKPEDFLSKRQKNPEKRFRNNRKECQACGISVYTEIEDVLYVRQAFPGLQSLKLAAVNLTPELGVIQPTPSQNAPSHHTLWLAIDAQPWRAFQIINIHN